MSKENYNIDSILSEVKKRREENEREIRENAAKKPVEDALEETVEETPEEAPETEEAPEAPSVLIVEEEPETEEVAETEEVPEAEKSIAPEPAAKKPDAKAKKKKRRKIIKRVIIAVIAILVCLGIAGGVYFNGLLDELLGNKSNNYTSTEEERWAGMDGDEEVFAPIYETEADYLSSLQDMMKNWYGNGVPCSKSKVLNVLLVGEDTRGSEILDDGTRADAAIIASINAETKEITLTSILRDAYAYYETKPDDASTAQFGKINGAMALGDISAYINCVENLYKIDIDNYVIVNFDSFEKIVDTLGGVTLEITSREINEINNHQKRYNKVYIEQTFEGTSGKMKLTGKQALAYCRIRKLDSDNMRADRQKTCLLQLFKQAKKASTTQLLKVVKELVPYVSTGFSKSEILKIAKYALTEHWLDYSTQTTSVPEANLKGGIYYGAWCWKCDYPQDAYNLQMLIYKKSSITLAHKRVDTAKCAETGFYEQGASPVWATITNNNYGEVTTLPTTEKEEDEEQ